MIGLTNGRKNPESYIIVPSTSSENRRYIPIGFLDGETIPTNSATIIEAEEYDDFIRREPKAKKYIKRLTGAAEFINNKDRYCLWLVDVSPKELRTMPLVMNRIELCR